MTKEEATDLIQANFLTGWGSTTPIAWDNVPFKQDEQSLPWVKLAVHHDNGDIATLGGVGARSVRHFANVWVVVNTLNGTGVKLNNQLAEQAELIFRYQHFALGNEAIWFRNVGTRTMGGEGKWYKQRVFARAIFDTFG